MTWNHDTLHDKTAAYTLSDKKKSHVNRVNSSGSVKLQNLTFGSEDGVGSYMPPMISNNLADGLFDNNF